MKKEFLKVLASVLLIFSISIVFVSCEKDPVKPVDENKHKDHEDPAKAELVLVLGHLHGAHGFHQNPIPQSNKYLKKLQKITFTNTAKGWAPTEESAKQFVVLSTERAKSPTDGAAVYGLIINYFATDGDTITQEFVENGQDKIHQHFFIPKEVKSFKSAVQNNNEEASMLFEYVYCDTDPWNKNMHSEGAKLIGDKNPIGFKGYFWFKKTHKEFMLNIDLMHAARSKFDESGKASPYYKPSSQQIQTDHWDLKMQVPIVVYADSYDWLEEDYDLSLSEKELKALLDNNKMDKIYVESIMKAYNLNLKEALKEIDSMTNGNWGDPESGQIWF